MVRATALVLLLAACSKPDTVEMRQPDGASKENVTALEDRAENLEARMNAVEEKASSIDVTSSQAASVAANQAVEVLLLKKQLREDEAMADRNARIVDARAGITHNNN